jgi:hypothetical protein
LEKVIKVISSDKDGADLRREESGNKYYSRCDGKADDQQINEAIQSAGKDLSFFIPANDWERIFGKGEKP